MSLHKFCLVSRRPPESTFPFPSDIDHGRVVLAAFHHLLNFRVYNPDSFSISVIGPILPSGYPIPLATEDNNTSSIALDFIDFGGLRTCDLSSQDIRVVPFCNIGKVFDGGFVDGPIKDSQGLVMEYCVWQGRCFMVEAASLHIMGLATQGRLTPLRLWYLFINQGFEAIPRPTHLEGVDYGGIDEYVIEDPEIFPGMTQQLWKEVEEITDVELVKQKLVHQGKFWMWMSPDRFPISPTDYDPPAPTLFNTETRSSENRAALEKLPTDIFLSIASILPLESLINLASISRSLRTAIFGNDYLARLWLSTSAPWWIPVPARLGRKQGTVRDDTTPSRNILLPYPASESSPPGETWDGPLHTTGLDWAYIRRCLMSGSMRNRRRIWNTVLDIERLADRLSV